MFCLVNLKYLIVIGDGTVNFQESDLELSDDVDEMIVIMWQLVALSKLFFHDYLIEISDASFLFWITWLAFCDADTKGDGKFKILKSARYIVLKNPSLIKNMTLPYLKWVACSKC